MSLFSSVNLLVYVIVLLIVAYYLGVRRSTGGYKGLAGILKVASLVGIGLIAIAALVISYNNPATRRGSTQVVLSTNGKDTADTLRQLEGEFMKASAEHGSPGYMSYYADASVELPNGAPALEGKESIAKTMGFLDDKNSHLSWTPSGADISSSGDLGYTYGTYEFQAKGKDGKLIVEHGKYTSIWKKQKDGQWKVVLDMGNASAPPKP